MYKKLGGVLLIGAILAVAAGCTTFKAEGLAFLPNSRDMEVVGHFDESKTVIELLGTSGGSNLLNITSGAMNDKITAIIWQEISKQGGNAAVNIEIRYWVGPLSKLVNVFTGTIIAPARVSIEGDVVLMGGGSSTASLDDAREMTAANIQQALSEPRVN